MTKKQKEIIKILFHDKLPQLAKETNQTLAQLKRKLSCN